MYYWQLISSKKDEDTALYVPLRVTLSRTRGVLSIALKSAEGKVRLPNRRVNRPNGRPLLDSPIPEIKIKIKIKIGIKMRTAKINILIKNEKSQVNIYHKNEQQDRWKQKT